MSKIVEQNADLQVGGFSKSEKVQTGGSVLDVARAGLRVVLGKRSRLSSLFLREKMDKEEVAKLKSSGTFQDHYILGAHLGSGSFGLVYKCFLKGDPSKELAVKTTKKTDSLSSEDIESVYREIKILKCLEGVNHVVQLRDFFDDSSYYMIVLELCEGGELFYRIINKKRYTEKDASKLVREMLEVVGACHMKGVIHRDLKPENFLFATEQETSELKIVDFGL